jgi:hypothetical protein
MKNNLHLSQNRKPISQAMDWHGKTIMKWFLIIPLVVLCGCAGVALRHDYADYSKMYADSVNKQLLLNLARLSHDEPVYFIQLGSISSQYQFSTSAGFMPTHSSVAHPGGAAATVAQDTLTLGGTLSAGFMENPIFQFLPLNGTNFVDAIVAPISDKIFLTFYDQGYPADLVARTMVASIQKEFTNSNGHTNCEFYINNPNDPTYPQFLEYCDDLRNAQLYHTLIVEMVSKDAPAVYRNKKAKLSDVVSAIQSGLSVKCDTNGDYIVTKPEQNLALVTKTDKDILETKGSLTDAQKFVKSIQEKKLKLKMRTFEAVMYSVAKEEVYFKNLEDPTNLIYKNIKFNDDGYGIIACVTRKNGSQFPVRPIMTITYGDNERFHLSKLIEANYHNVIYSVGDLEGKEVSQDPMCKGMKLPGNQNRTVFTMISYLFSQIAIDTQKLPVQQLIQVQ